MTNSNFPFSGDLISGRDAFIWIRENFPLATAPVSLASAYVKYEAIEPLLGLCPSKGRLLARWRLGDLIAKSSDIDAYELAHELGWSFYISQNFHGKLYQVPGIGTVVGSANATLSGLSIYHQGNDEVSTVVSNTARNEAVVEDIFGAATLVTPDLFRQLKEVYVKVSSKSPSLIESEGSEWPTELIEQLNPTVPTGLFVSDCFSTLPGSDSGKSDCSLLGYESLSSLSDEVVSRAIVQTKIYKWLVSACKEGGGSMYFGELTAKLHNDLLDDPLPYRSSIKELLSLLLAWVDKYCQNRILITRPAHSQKVELITG